MRNRIDFNAHGVGTPTKTLLVSVVREILKDNSCSITFTDPVTALGRLISISQTLDIDKIIYVKFGQDPSHVLKYDDENSLILALAKYLKTTAFVSISDVDEF